MQRFRLLVCLGALLGVGGIGCGRSAIVSSDLPVRRVVVYRNGVAYFERAGHVDESEVRFKMRETEVGDFLATLAVIEKGGSSVRAAAFPLKDEEDEPKPKSQMTPDERRGIRSVVLSLDGREHDLEIGYVAASPVWRPSYRLVVDGKAPKEATLQAWGIVQNLSGEDWRDVKLSLVAGAPLAFEAQLGASSIPQRPIVTDEGEVIAAVPKGDTTLEEANEQERKPRDEKRLEALKKESAALDAEESDAPEPAAQAATGAAAPAKADRARTRGSRGPGGRVTVAETKPASPPPPPPPPPRSISAPRNVRSLAAVAVESGATRYDLPNPVTIPDKTATMVMLLNRKVPGGATFLFAPDGGVPDSASHPFRVARFTNRTGGVLERGPIAVFEQGSFLGQGVLDPLPAGATATVPFALERGLAVDQERKYDELGERVAKIENLFLTIERDAVTRTTYRVKNGLDQAADVLVRHPRNGAARLHQPPTGTEDNVGTGTALVPGRVGALATGEIVVDERMTLRRGTDWFTPIADAAVTGYLKDPKADREVVAKLTQAWAVRKEIVEKIEARAKHSEVQNSLQMQSDETRRNLRAIEKNKAADQLRARLTARLAEWAQKLDELTKKIVELDAKLAELKVQFREVLRDVKIEVPSPKKG
ncbi:MAG: DUF4139 domain-containing protein [Polyangiaceae bacterium]